MGACVVVCGYKMQWYRLLIWSALQQMLLLQCPATVFT